MDSSRKTYFSTATSMISSLFGIVLWASRLPFTMQNPKQYPTHQNIHLGLKTLIIPQPANKNTNHSNQDLHHHHHPHIVHGFTVSSSSQASSSRSDQYSVFLDSTSSWSSSAMDDLIGTDSGVPIMLSDESNKLCLNSTEISVPLTLNNKRSGSERICDWRKKEYPPPIPLLAQTGNLTCRMPWTLSRHCYPDGRLVLIGEKVKHHEYFECRREDGRLVLNLISLDNTLTCLVDDEHVVVREEDEQEEEEEMEMMEEDVQFGDGGEEDEIEATHMMSDNEDEKCDKNGSYNLETITRCKRYGNLSKDFKSEGRLVDLESSWSSSSVSFGTKKNKNIHRDKNNFFVHPASAPLGPLMVSVM